MQLNLAVNCSLKKTCKLKKTYYKKGKNLSAFKLNEKTVVPDQTLVSEMWQNFKFKDQTCINDFSGGTKENIQKLIIVLYTHKLIS